MICLFDYLFFLFICIGLVGCGFSFFCNVIIVIMGNLDFLSKRIFRLLWALLVFWCTIIPCHSAGCEKIANLNLFKMRME